MQMFNIIVLRILTISRDDVTDVIHLDVTYIYAKSCNLHSATHYFDNVFV